MTLRRLESDHLVEDPNGIGSVSSTQNMYSRRNTQGKTVPVDANLQADCPAQVHDAVVDWSSEGHTVPRVASAPLGDVLGSQGETVMTESGRSRSTPLGAGVTAAHGSEGTPEMSSQVKSSQVILYSASQER